MLNVFKFTFEMCSFPFVTFVLEKPLPVPVTWLSHDHQARKFVEGLIEWNSNLKRSSRVLVDLFIYLKKKKNHQIYI